MLTSLQPDFCICCHSRLGGYDEFCEKCQTPISLSQSVIAQGGGHNFISILGASNAGKTNYVGLLLDMLGKCDDRFGGTGASAFTVDLQESVVSALENRTFPEKTPTEADAWHWLHCKLSMKEKKGTRNLDLISPDFAGEAIAAEISNPGMYPAVEQVVTRSMGLMILCDSLKVRDQGSTEDLFAMKLATYIAERHLLFSDEAQDSDGPALAIVFTKCDTCDEAMNDPAQFARNNTSRLHDFCNKTFSRVQYFAAGIVGSTGMLSDSRGRQMRVPFHVQPHGILEPLQWLVAST